MHYPPVTTSSAPAVYRVLWPVGDLGWRPCSRDMYERILAEPGKYSGVKVAMLRETDQPR